MKIFKYFKRFGCDHRYKEVRRWSSGFFGIALWGYQDIQCIKCDKKRTIDGSIYLRPDGTLTK